MNSPELERMLAELRDANRQLAESSRQIAQSLGNIERMWTANMQALRLTKWALWPVIVLVLLAFIPMGLAMWKLLR